MKVTFYSNFLNHHQLPFCIEMANRCDFTFVATTPINNERLNFGYRDMNHQYPFVLCAYDSVFTYQRALTLADESDVIIHGSASEEFVKRRMKTNQLTFRYSERVYKQGVPWYKLPVTRVRTYYRSGRHKNLYLLCASAYTSADYQLLGAFQNKAYKWGYFPEVKKYDSIEKLIENKEHNTILWVGRLISWKHPEASLLVAKRLKDLGYSFNLKIIGNGEMEPTLKQMIHDNNLDDFVYLLGSMPPEAVREHMENAGIFLFTSDFNEGWGAVLNESMNSGCAVVASHAIGSVPFLLEHGENGFVYKNGDIDDLYSKVQYLLENPEKQAEFGKNAYKTLTDTWNAPVAADRFIQLVQEIQKHGQCNLFDDGPCSRAEILKNNWFMKNEY